MHRAIHFNEYPLSILILTAATPTPPLYLYAPLLPVPLGLTKLTVTRNDMYS